MKPIGTWLVLLTERVLVHGAAGSTITRPVSSLHSSEQLLPGG